jgi:hypothetical protein
MCLPSFGGDDIDQESRINHATAKNSAIGLPRISAGCGEVR